MLGKILDYSSARPDLKAVKAAGYEAIFRYVSSASWKRLGPTERDDILAAGLDIGLHGEDEADAWTKGYSRGLEQGRNWTSYARYTLDAPKGMTIVAAIDTALVYPSNPTALHRYLDGLTDGFAGYYELGVYGDYGAIVAAYNAGQGKSCYVMTNAWDINTPPQFCHIHQYGSDARFPGCDYNDVLRRPYGSWLQTLGGVMATLDSEDLANIANAVWAKLLLNSATGVKQTAADRLVGAQAQTNLNDKVDALPTLSEVTSAVSAALALLPATATPEEVATAVVAALPSSVTGGITKAEVAASLAAASAVLGG